MLITATWKGRIKIIKKKKSKWKDYPFLYLWKRHLSTNSDFFARLAVTIATDNPFPILCALEVALPLLCTEMRRQVGDFFFSLSLPSSRSLPFLICAICKIWAGFLFELVHFERAILVLNFNFLPGFEAHHEFQRNKIGLGYSTV